MVVLSSFAEIEAALGFETEKQTIQTEISPLDEFFQTPMGPVATKAIDTTKEKFAEWGHSPSNDHWKGLVEIAKVFEDMAEGRADSAFHISSLPPGMGKTTVAVEGTKALLADLDRKGVGVIYFLSRLEEIRTLVERMGLERDSFAVLTSDDELNALGNPASEHARVLFTTQKRLEVFSKSGAAFADMKDLRYKGKARQVRVWDEAILPSLTLTASKDGLYGLLGGLRRVRPALAEEIEEFAISLRKHDGETVTMPDIDREGIELDEFRGLFSTDSDKDTAEALWYLSGRVCRVRVDNLNGATSLDYEDILPDDLAPMLILDASGDLRQTYKFWADERRNLRRLYSPKKSYAGLTIHHWERAAGKNKNHHRNIKDIEAIADGVVRMIAEIPEAEPVLVIHHKGRLFKNKRTGEEEHDRYGIVETIRQKVSRRSGDISFVNWGRHTATNEYKDVRHVILAGTLNYNLAQYEAVGRAAKKAKVEDVFTDDDMRQTRIGEISHHIFQAAGRGSIRKTVNGGCPEGCNLYAVFSTHKVTGFPKEQLLRIFPDAGLLDWSPDGPDVQKRLTGKIGEAVEFILSIVSSGATVTTTEVRDLLGMSRSNFKSDVTDHPDFRQASKVKGIVLRQEKGKPGTFQKAD